MNVLGLRLWFINSRCGSMLEKRKRLVLLVPWLMLCASAATASMPAPRADVASLDALPIVLPKPYEPAADADAAVNAAFVRARSSGKRVLIELGGNWCADCVILTNVMRLPNVAPFIEAHYEVVLVDVGRFNRNLQIPARFGFTHRLEGVPVVLVTDADGKLLNTADTTALVPSRDMTPQAIVDWLARWAN